MREGRVVRVSGPLVVAEGLTDAKMYEVVRVGEKGLIGEIIEIKRGLASIQVYEETTGIGLEEPVYATGEPLSVELGPGLLTSIYDGIQRPLNVIRDMVGDYVVRGVDAPAVDRKKKWSFKPLVKVGYEVEEGDVIGEVPETSIITHKVLVPPGVKRGKVKKIEEGDFTVEDTVAVIESGGKEYEVKMIQRWPVRKPRPYKKKLAPREPLITGQRVIDTLFPVARGGTACIPGPFGSGKTVTQHQLAKWANSEIVVFIGCGERGNEMTDVLIEFPELTDPYTGKPLMERTVLIANTSNMPVAAREASIYTGITIAEYFRDMGYSVTLQADSTSRWAEALREISGRLEEMPGEEGYPAYLSSKLAAFYERAGRVVCLGSQAREGAVTAIGSVSPPGGDLSEPVVQATLRVVKVFWALEDRLAYERHFPAINWLVSYSLYVDKMEDYLREEIAPDFGDLRREAMSILQREAELKEIVRLIGMDALSAQERILMEVARSIREDFLQQNAFHEVDTFTSLKKQYLMLKNILHFYHQAVKALERGIPLEEIVEAKIREKIARQKYVSEKKIEEIEGLSKEIEDYFTKIPVGEV
jgi:V/A-type H+-transporting ATPase subunit A